MSDKWRFNRFRDPLGVLGVVVVWLLFQNLSLCWCLNDEGNGNLSCWVFFLVFWVLGEVKGNG